ncbi:hypothetical protein GCM10010406_25530 [Streptomyces thermolineatus]|uniref:Integral membrane protein n=1 Tax=Streptomyces thermolineatus TaxID=44033 RepID=A0ABN3LQ99_9ACTN
MSVTARTWPPGFTHYLGYLLLGVASLMLCCGWGWLIGRLPPSRWGALTGAFVWVLANLAVDTDLVVVNGPARDRPDLLLIALRIAAAALLLGACLWLPLGRGMLRRAPLPAVAAALASTVLASGLSAVAPRQGPESMTCVEGATTICLWPEEENYRAMAERVLDRADGLPAELSMPDKVYSRGLIRVDGEWGGDFDLDSGSEWAMSDGVTRAVSAETFAACREDDLAGWDKYNEAGDQSVLALERWLEKRLAGGGQPEYRESGMSEAQADAIEKGKAMADRPAAEQERWARDTVRFVQETYCD